MAEGNYTVSSSIKERYTEDFQKLYESMRGLKYQMTDTLLLFPCSTLTFKSSSNLV